MPRKSTAVTITVDDVYFIFYEHEDQLDLCLSTCWCGHCKNTPRSIIVNYKAELNHLLDVVLNGFCFACDAPIKRYIETGANPHTKKKAEAIWLTHFALKELKIKKQR